MKFDQDQFISKFPKDVYDICVMLSREGFCLTLVGGAVRDFLMTGELSKDLDFEIKHLYSYEEDKWFRMLERVFKKIEKQFDIKVEAKGVGVYSTKVGESELEFSSPRLEEFNNKKSHKNFKPHFISNLETKEAFKRRDFTINAMGIFFGPAGSVNEFSLLDPFGGLENLNSKVLRNIDDDFYKDPVRFLRLIRFKLKYDLSIDEDIIKNLSKFNLNEVSNFYINKEFEKSLSLDFFKELFLYIDNGSIIKNKLSQLRPLINLNSLNSIIKYDSNLLLDYIILSKELSDLDKSEIAKYFSYSEKKLKRLLTIQADLLNFDSLEDSKKVTVIEQLLKIEGLRENLQGQLDSYKEKIKGIKFVDKHSYLESKAMVISEVKWQFFP